jgi:hypothetical protein
MYNSRNFRPGKFRSRKFHSRKIRNPVKNTLRTSLSSPRADINLFQVLQVFVQTIFITKLLHFGCQINLKSKFRSYLLDKRQHFFNFSSKILKFFQSKTL